ncbi:acetoacetyl-CoA synthetase-like [Dysidea avara]|uniref:acetoacetyl-CoA synthetase-like n=1 Tax=Dysidea avara TaxID=196820 RepID=UPI003329C12F
MDSSKMMWCPKSGKQTNIDMLRERVNSRHKLTLRDYKELYLWSVDNYDLFWEEFWHFADILHSKPYDQVVDTTRSMEEVPEWFHGSRLNYAENMLQYKDKRTAIIECGEGHVPKEITFAELHTRVSVIAAALTRFGIKPGDRIVGYLPNCSLAVEAMLATSSIGAIWSSTSPDFGVSGVLSRFSQIKPRVIFSVEAVRYNSKQHDHLEKLRSVVKELPELEKVIVMPFCMIQEDIDISSIPNSVFLSDFTRSHYNVELQFEQLPFNHPLFIMFSSGTTGTPKCMVHTAGGTLIQHLKEHILQGNMTRDDKILYYTTTGWMMWNWLVTSLAVGATVVLYDGSPFVPSPSVLWDLIDSYGITILGTGAKWIATLEDRELRPINTHSLASLHTILSTGSPLMPHSYDYVYSCVKSDLLLGSISGGTDIISCFAGQNPTVPVYRGQIQSRNLGMAMECWNEEGRPVLDASGELVCTRPFPSMPSHFWNDPDGAKYRKAYFSKYPGIWHHGDYCLINSHTGGILMLGRSDGTLNPSGVRFGTAELYDIVEKLSDISDSVCVGQQVDGDERVILFVKMAKGGRFTEDLVIQIKSTIRKELSARHVPSVILEIADIPYTTNGKKVEVAIKKILAGDQVNERGALMNPDSLNLYCNIPQLSTVTNGTC